MKKLKTYVANEKISTPPDSWRLVNIRAPLPIEFIESVVIDRIPVCWFLKFCRI